MSLMLIYYDIYESPIGKIKIIANKLGILECDFVDEVNLPDISHNEHTVNCKTQLKEYFNKERKNFDLNLIMEGTIFQKSVWSELLNIQYGEIKSYKDIAIALNNPNASRAVGNANNKNNISIIIPCHRVVGENRKLIGYAGGLWRKEWLLNLEQGK
jgi:methylated-DNA-[protein]-cysteine S-methyltransferase